MIDTEPIRRAIQQLAEIHGTISGNFRYPPELCQNASRELDKIENLLAAVERYTKTMQAKKV